jgi:tRNA(Ile)-lysidine synthase
LIARPLLHVSRAEIESAARKARLRWIEDPSNAETRYSRNFVRQRLMPLIREHGLAQTRRWHAARCTWPKRPRLLDERAEQDLAALADGAGLSVSALRALPVPRRRNALRGFIARSGNRMPEASRLRRCPARCSRRVPMRNPKSLGKHPDGSKRRPSRTSQSTRSAP